MERAQDADPDFALSDANAPDVAAICAHLDGSAARDRAGRGPYPADDPCRPGHPDRSPARPAHRRPARPAGPAADAAWHHRLELRPARPGEQALFARLAVFNGGFSARCRRGGRRRRVAGGSGDLPVPVPDGLAALVTKNLLVQEERSRGERHYHYLETIREYALERLAACGEEVAVRDRHAAFYLRLAEAASPYLTSQDQQHWLDRLESARDNLHAALEWYVQRGATESSLRLVAALWKFWHIRSRHTEGRLWMTMALEPGGACADEVRAHALHGAGWLAVDRNDPGLAEAYFTESLSIFRRLRDAYGVAEALQGVGVCAQARDEHADRRGATSRRAWSCTDRGDDEGVAWSLDHLGDARLNMADHGRADALFAESLAIFRRLGHAWGTAISLHHQGLAALATRGAGAGRRAPAGEPRPVPGARQRLGHRHLLRPPRLRGAARR